MKKCKNEAKIIFHSRSVNERLARSIVAAFAAQVDPPVSVLADLRTAVSEAVTNAIVHAYPDSIGRICLRARILESGELEISIRDWGKGIEDVEMARTPLFTTGGAERSGMGFTIMESFMSQMRVTSTVGKGTTVYLRRKIVKRGQA